MKVEYGSPEDEKSHLFFLALQGSYREGDDPIRANVQRTIHTISEMECGVPVNKKTL
jgi:hypothetical protein